MAEQGPKNYDKDTLKVMSEKLPKEKESLTDIDWPDLMGANRGTYRRSKGGAIRRT